ncbi:hypothetical protein GCM10009664_73730 [Kitasatospora gansuensis]
MTAVPILLIVVSVVLQACADGYLSGRLEFGDSLLFSCLAFVAATVLFGSLCLIRRARQGARPDRGAEQRGTVRKLIVLMNLATAVTFLGFFSALAWVPAALATSVQSGIGPLAVVCIALIRRESAPAAGRLAGALGLLGLSVLIAVRLNPEPGALSLPMVGGTLLVAVSGVSAALLARISRQLGAAGADPLWVTANRFHFTYLAAGALLLARGGVGGTGGADRIPLPLMALTALAAVALPLFLLQVGLQRAEPLLAMALLSTLPGITYLSQTVFGGPLDPVACALIGLLVLLAAACARQARTAAPARRVAAPA